MTQLTLIGILDDGVAGLSDTARQRLANAQVVIGAGRTLDLVCAHLSLSICHSPTKEFRFLKRICSILILSHHYSA